MRRIWRANCSGNRPEGSTCAAARDELAFRNQVSNRRISEYQNLLAARKRVETIRAEQERLVEDERRLADLQSEYSSTRKATDRARLLEKAVAWIEARRTVSDLVEDLARFPADMDKLCGDEAERLRQLRAKLTADPRRETAERKRRNATAGERLDGGRIRSERAG